MAVKTKKCKKAEFAKYLPFPAEDADKYTRGRLVVVGGSAAYPGAACLASKAGYLVGAGYVEVVCSPETLPVVHGYNPNVVARAWEGWTAASSRLDVAEPEHPCACLIGSGFDRPTDDECLLFREVLQHVQHPVVIDGGAITILATDEGRSLAASRASKGLKTVVTPHFGEAARLAEPLRIHEPEDPHVDHAGDAVYAQQLADAYSSVVVLKGADTFIARPHDIEKDDDVVYVMTKGTAALAKAGTGDVLAGIISGLLSQGLNPQKGATLGALLHAEAGRAASASIGEISVCATDVADFLPQAICGFC